MFSGFRSTKYLERATGHVSPPTESIRGWNSLFLLCSPPCLVFVGLSVNCTNSTPSSFLQSWKSSIFIAWCSWRSRRPKNCVKSHQIAEVSASRVLEPIFFCLPQHLFFFLNRNSGFIWTFAHTGLAKLPSFPVKNFLGRVELPVSYDGKLVSFLI